MRQALELSHLAPETKTPESLEAQARRLEAASLLVEDFADPQRMAALEALLAMPDPAAAKPELARIVARDSREAAGTIDREVARFVELSDSLPRADEDWPEEPS